MSQAMIICKLAEQFCKLFDVEFNKIDEAKVTLDRLEAAVDAFIKLKGPLISSRELNAIARIGSMDTIFDEFVDDCLVSNAGSRVSAKELYDRYAMWHFDNVNRYIPSLKVFFRYMNLRFIREKSKGLYYFKDIFIRHSHAGDDQAKCGGSKPRTMNQQPGTDL